MNDNPMIRLLELVDKYGYSVTFERDPEAMGTEMICAVFRKKDEKEPCLKLCMGSADDYDDRARQADAVDFWLFEYLYTEEREELRDERKRKP